MSFYEWETWTLKDGIDRVAYDKIISDWFDFIVEHREKLFPEWLSAKYFRFTDRDGNPTGRYVMMFEYESLEAHHAYKERRKDWDGPYEAYKAVDPYQEFFNLDTVTCEYLDPQAMEKWFNFGK